jgi:hypothetical protein
MYTPYAVRDMQVEIEAVREASAAKEVELAQLRQEQSEQRETERKAMASLEAPDLQALQANNQRGLYVRDS